MATRKRKTQDQLHGYNGKKYKPPLPDSWEYLGQWTIPGMVFGEHYEGQIGLKVCRRNGAIMVKQRPHNVAKNELLIPLR